MLDNESERLQALRIIRKSCTVCPQQFPNAFTHSLAAIAMCSHGPSKDQLHRACVATLCELCKVSISYFVNLIYIIYNMFYFFFCNKFISPIISRKILNYYVTFLNLIMPFVQI